MLPLHNGVLVSHLKAMKLLGKCLELENIIMNVATQMNKEKYGIYSVLSQ